MVNRRSPDAPNPTDSTSSPKGAAARRPPRSRQSPVVAPPRASVTAEARRALIAESAYLRAEQRGFAPGHETEDWLAAEVEVDALLKVGHGGSAQ
jgi:hypothetical protein